MSTKLTLAAIAVFLSVLVTACGGGGDENSDVTIYGTCGNTPNYLGELGESGRWKKFPVTIGLDFAAAQGFSDPSIAESYLRAVQAGASGWNVGNGVGVVNFVIGRNADIVIEFDSGFGSSTMLGLAVAQWDGRYMTRLSRLYLNAIYFGNLARNASRASFERELQEVVQHEVGHILFTSSASGGNGRQGHSSDPRDAMYPSTRGSVALSQRDINSIREAYCRKQ